MYEYYGLEIQCGNQLKVCIVQSAGFITRNFNFLLLISSRQRSSEEEEDSSQWTIRSFLLEKCE